MTDPDYDPSIDSDIDPLELEIRKRVKLSFASVSEVAASAGLESFAHKLFEELSKFGYVYGRLYEMLRTRRKQYDTRIPGVTGEWAEFYANGENGGWDWKADFPPKRGQPAHDTLLDMYQLLEIFWKCLPPPSTKKRRKKWSPRFERQEGITVPYNDMGILFLGVARLFHYD